MKCSELIERLQSLKQEHGDCEVVANASLRVRDEDGDYALDNNCRYSYEDFYDLNLCGVKHEDSCIVLSIDDF